MISEREQLRTSSRPVRLQTSPGVRADIQVIPSDDGRFELLDVDSSDGAVVVQFDARSKVAEITFVGGVTSVDRPRVTFAVPSGAIVDTTGLDGTTSVWNVRGTVINRNVLGPVVVAGADNVEIEQRPDSGKDFGSFELVDVRRATVVAGASTTRLRIDSVDDLELTTHGHISGGIERIYERLRFVNESGTSAFVTDVYAPNIELVCNDRSGLSVRGFLPTVQVSTAGRIELHGIVGTVTGQTTGRGVVAISGIQPRDASVHRIKGPQANLQRPSVDVIAYEDVERALKDQRHSPKRSRLPRLRMLPFDTMTDVLARTRPPERNKMSTPDIVSLPFFAQPRGRVVVASRGRIPTWNASRTHDGRYLTGDQLTNRQLAESPTAVQVPPAAPTPEPRRLPDLLQRYLGRPPDPYDYLPFKASPLVDRLQKYDVLTPLLAWATSVTEADKHPLGSPERQAHAAAAANRSIEIRHATVARGLTITFQQINTDVPGWVSQEGRDVEAEVSEAGLLLALDEAKADGSLSRLLKDLDPVIVDQFDRGIRAIVDAGRLARGETELGKNESLLRLPETDAAEKQSTTFDAFDVL